MPTYAALTAKISLYPLLAGYLVTMDVSVLANNLAGEFNKRLRRQ